MWKLTKWLTPVFTLLMLLSANLTPQRLSAQTVKQLTLEEAYDFGRKNYPLIRQKDLVNKTAELTIANLQKGFLPQIAIAGQASYQSAVTEILFPVAGVGVTPLSKDQYRLVSDISQMVYDGGVIKEQKNLQQLGSEVEQQRIEVDLYKIKERISNVYLSILFLDEQLKQVDLIKADLGTGIKRVDAQVNNGTAFRSSVSLLQAELLDAEQRAIEIKATRNGFLQMLALFINQPLTAETQLQTPAPFEIVSANTAIVRPELQYYSSQDKFLSGQTQLINSKNHPRVSLFLQAGYGRPGLNFLKNEFDPYYVGGVRMNWTIGGYYTQKKEKELVEVNRKMVDAQKDAFLLTTRTSLVQQQAEIDRMQQLVDTDQEIIELRIKVKDAARAQLENGVITANDYLLEVNAEDKARRSYITHQLQLLQAKINYKTISGN